MHQSLSRGPHTNASQFYVTAAPLAFLDGKKVAFGRVIDGLRTIKVGRCRLTPS